MCISGRVLVCSGRLFADGDKGDKSPGLKEGEGKKGEKVPVGRPEGRVCVAAAVVGVASHVLVADVNV
jgi:hypothetical protein